MSHQDWWLYQDAWFNKIHQPSTWIEMPAVHTTGIIEKREYHKVIGEDDGF